MRDTSGKSAEKPAETKVLGMSLGELTDEARKSGGIADDIKGVLITSVEPNSAAAEKQVLPGEIITEVAQESVSSPKEFADKIDALKKDGRKNALLMVSSKTGELRFLTLRIE
jgi:serine protease Do